MKSIFIALLILMPAVVFAQRDSLNVLDRSSAVGVEDEHATAFFYAASPVAMLYRGKSSLTRLDVRVDLRREQEARLQQLGDGALVGGFYADSYLQLSDRSVLWADARYVRGNRSNVCWNSTADYLLLYPYIVADSVGGDLSTEEYAFGGGYAHRAGRFDFAIRGDYRAGQEYRQVDPRPRDIVSDFTVKISVGLELNEYVIGIDLQGRLYKQQQDVKFYDVRGANTAVLFMTGLGGYFPRYSGIRQQNQIVYDGKGYTLAAQVIPQRGHGWYARAVFENFAADRNYVPNNSIPVSRLQTRQTTLAAAYRSDCWSFRAEGGYELRRGIELIADRNGQGGIVDEQAMYRNHTWRALTEATVEWRREGMRYTLQPRAEWWRSDAAYLYPARSMTLTRLGGSVRGGVEWLSALWRVKAVAGIGYSVSPGKKTLLLAGVEEPMAEFLTDTADRLSDRALAPEVSFRAERNLRRKLACFAEAGWSPRFYGGGASEHVLTVACGILF